MISQTAKTGTTRILTIGLQCVLIVAAAACAKPKVQVQVSRNQIEQGEDLQVSWTSKNANTITLNGQQVGKVGAQVFTPVNSTSYTAVALRGKREARDTKDVTVNPRAPKPTIIISTDQSSIERGQSTSLRWSSTNADKVEIAELGDVPTSGSRVVNPSESTTYAATATGRGGSETASTRLTVTDAALAAERPRTTNPAIARVFDEWVPPVFFDYDRATLRPEAKKFLQRAAEWLTEGPNRTIFFRIEGNCDPRGTEEYNIGLGERRAQAAKEYLVSLGVAPGRIQTVSFGEERAEGLAEGFPNLIPSWAHDRRNDFVYVSGGETPPNP
jgi:peptidoglycan-associated lipoprotein